jgi:hypothetical protein
MISPYRATLTSKRDHFEAMLEFNILFAKLLKSVGWTLEDYFRSFPGG